MTDKFHSELKNLKSGVSEMARFALSMLQDSQDAFINQDDALATSVLDRKDRLREMTGTLEENCYQLIALNQPVAKDMRTIVCSLKVIAASERIGRYGKSTAKIVKEIAGKPHIANMMSLPLMSEYVLAMIDDSVTAYEAENIKKLEGFSARDDAIDALRHSIFREAITYMMENPKTITQATFYIIIARYLERCADHACKIAENVQYMETGEMVEIK
ncbi:MAG: phosphate signaling complex protein PhoU [Methanoregula sp.]|jgi:phosphate transport system protein|uniref:phosphate signaling complex protein PhoU n=1 Tax=Methanoregula sp. TaxID=2052170 RepID=UPI003C71D679